MAAKKGGLGKGLDSLLVNKVNADHSSDSTIVKEKSTTTKKKSTKKRNTRHHGKTFPGGTES